MLLKEVIANRLSERKAAGAVCMFDERSQLQASSRKVGGDGVDYADPHIQHKAASFYMENDLKRSFSVNRDEV